jgi:hypothetical protein
MDARKRGLIIDIGGFVFLNAVHAVHRWGRSTGDILPGFQEPLDDFVIGGLAHSRKPTAVG